MSVAAGIAQPRKVCGELHVDRDIDNRRYDHAARSRKSRKRPARPGRQFAVDDLALDLQADQQEEQGHQPVVDPGLDGQGS